MTMGKFDSQPGSTYFEGGEAFERYLDEKDRAMAESYNSQKGLNVSYSHPFYNSSDIVTAEDVANNLRNDCGDFHAFFCPLVGGYPCEVRKRGCSCHEVYLKDFHAHTMRDRLGKAAPALLTACKALLNATMFKDHPAESQMAIDAIKKAGAEP